MLVLFLVNNHQLESICFLQHQISTNGPKRLILIGCHFFLTNHLKSATGICQVHSGVNLRRPLQNYLHCLAAGTWTGVWRRFFKRGCGGWVHTGSKWGYSPDCNVVFVTWCRLLSQKRLTKEGAGGHWHPRTPIAIPLLTIRKPPHNSHKCTV